MTRLGSLQGHHAGDTNTATTHFPFGNNNCLNCGQKLLTVSSTGNNHEAPIGAGIVAFTSFVKNVKTQVFIRNALKEIYSILHGIEWEDDLEHCALCVDCCLVFAQLFGLFQTFESRRQADGFLGTVLARASRWASELRGVRLHRTTIFNENEKTVQADDLTLESETCADGYANDDCDSMEVEIHQVNESGSDDDIRAEDISSGEMEGGHPRASCDDAPDDIFTVILASDSDYNHDRPNRTSPECEISEEESDDGSLKSASRSITTSNVSSIPGDGRTIAMSSSHSATRLRKSRRIEGKEQYATSIDVDETNVKSEASVESDYLPTSCNSESDDDDDDDDGDRDDLSDPRKNIVYRCADCTEEFLVPSALGRHRKNIHDSSVLFKCHMCFSNFRHGRSLTTHLRTHEQKKLHGKITYTEAEKIFKCIDCDEKFPLAPQLRRHRVDVHGADQHTLICHICQYSTSHGASFKSHMLLHTGTEEHKCSKCGKSFNLFKKLQVHMKTQHKIMLRRNFNNFQPDPLCEKVILRCRKCEAEFECEEGLFKHSKEVHGGGFFRCDICKSTFFQEHVLRRHMQEHGKPKSKCRFCDKQYRSRSGRRVHEMNVHQASVTAAGRSSD